MMYATIGSDGQPTGFYSKLVHGKAGSTTIPVDAVMIPDAVWHANISGIRQIYNRETQQWSIFKDTQMKRLIIARAKAVASMMVTYNLDLANGVLYSGVIMQSDARSMNAISDILTALANGWLLPAGFIWIDAANTPHPADVAWLQGLSAAFADHKSALFTRLQAAKKAIAAAKTVAAINKIKL